MESQHTSTCSTRRTELAAIEDGNVVAVSGDIWIASPQAIVKTAVLAEVFGTFVVWIGRVVVLEVSAFGVS